MIYASLLVLKAMFGRVRTQVLKTFKSARYSIGKGRRLPESLSNGALADRDWMLVSYLPCLIYVEDQ